MVSASRDPSDRRKAALEKAMVVFWQRGVNATSYPELVDATGLSRKSLYAQWPDKQALLQDALQHYDETVLQLIRGALLPPGYTTLVAFWQAFEAAISTPHWNGCLLLRSASGDLRHDPATAQRLLTHLDVLKQRLTDCIIVAQREGRIGPAVDAAHAPTQVLGLLSYLSLIGGMEGFGPRAKAVLDEAKAACGL